MELQRNYITKQAYEGVNQSELLTEQTKKGYNSSFWLTFLQAKDNGLKIKKGEHGCIVVRFITDEVLKNGKIVKTGGRKLYTVFNLDQTESQVKRIDDLHIVDPVSGKVVTDKWSGGDNR
jgi:antirestriction protein ArdC